MYFLDMSGAESKRIKCSTAPESCGKAVEKAWNNCGKHQSDTSRVLKGAQGMLLMVVTSVWRGLEGTQ